VSSPTDYLAQEAAFKALANARRLQILDWLKDPRAHFPPQVDGDLVDDGVCAVWLAEKLGVTAPTLSEHMRILTQAGLVRAKRIKQWTFYRRDDEAIAALSRTMARDI
jgi:DNA-binding transcriptional ArsR family regulator